MANDSSSEDWWDKALCRDYPPYVFFPETVFGVNAARKICSNCPVMRQCASYAIEQKIDHGVWGGMSERARRRAQKGAKRDYPKRHQEIPVLPAERPPKW